MASCEALNKIKILQNKCIQMIKPKQKVQAIYKELNLLELIELIEIENKKLGYKIYNSLLPIQMLNTIKSNAQSKTLSKKHKYNTRNKKVPYLPKTKNTAYQQSFLYCGLKTLSTIPMEMLELPNTGCFVKFCKKDVKNKL